MPRNPQVCGCFIARHTYQKLPANSVQFELPQPLKHNNYNALRSAFRGAFCCPNSRSTIGQQNTQNCVQILTLVAKPALNRVRPVRVRVQQCGCGNSRKFGEQGVERPAGPRWRKDQNSLLQAERQHPKAQPIGLGKLENRQRLTKSFCLWIDEDNVAMAI